MECAPPLLVAEADDHNSWNEFPLAAPANAPLVLEERPSSDDRGLAAPYFFSVLILSAARVENTQLGNRAR
jgi:hypothetical protein